MNKIKKVSILILLCFIITSIYLPAINSQELTVEYYLTLETYPEEVEMIDPDALTGEGIHPSGVVIVDAKQTISSGDYHYEFAEWVGTIDWPYDPEDEPVLEGNQAFVFLDGDLTVTAKYADVPIEYYLTLETYPDEVEMIDPNALTGEGYYPSGVVIVDAKQTILSGNVRYEFAEWVGTVDWPYDPEDEPELEGNQAFVFMDADLTVTAKYADVPNIYTLALETDPNILALDPDALQGAGVYNPGDTATISAEPYVYDSDMTRYKFYRWTSSDIPNPSGNPAEIAMDKDITITAEYTLYFYLDAVTDPLEVQTIDPKSVSGMGWYRSGTYGLVDAKQTVASGQYNFEFLDWETQDQYYDEGGNPVTLPPNQAARFMDSPFTMVAQYETLIEKWDVKLTGEFDYLEFEPIKVRLAALVTNSESGAPVSNVDVTIDIYDEDGGKVASTVMVENLIDTGIYEYLSPQTIEKLMQRNKIDKGVYLVHVQVLRDKVPVASDIIEFHIDPPGGDTSRVSATAIALIAVLASAITPLILTKKVFKGIKL